MSGAPLLCPGCREPLDPATFTCDTGHRFAENDGVLVLLAQDFAADLASFNEVLRAYRESLGRRLLDPAVYDALPHGQRHDFEWRLRCFDLEVLRPLLAGRRRPSVLDVGSFNGWLASHLSRQGCDVTAVDYFDDPCDGLRARRFYSRAPWRSIQLDLLDLSLLNRAYDLVVLNRCLQFFPDPAAYLEHAGDRVAPGGLLVATGLDFYRDPRRKQRSVADLEARHRERYGRAFFLHPTRGYLDFEDRRRLEARGLEVRRYPQLWRANLRSLLLPDRPRFCFGVWKSPV